MSVQSKLRNFCGVVFTILLIPVLANTASAATITVCASGCDQSTIQGGIDAAVDGDIVLVSDGTYNEGINFNGKAITVTSVNGASSTNITGSSSYSGETLNSVLDGFTINTGIDIQFSSPTITNNIILGGLFIVLGSSPVISNNTIMNNSGKGIAVYSSSSPTIENNTISGNSSNAMGGGILIYSSSAIIRNNTITMNTAEYGGGIMIDSSPSSIITNNVITGNTATLGGGGVTIANTSTAIVANNTITGNTGGGISAHFSSSPTITDTILWGNGTEIYDDGTNTITVSYSIVQGGYAGTGNIDADPLFVDPVNGDYHLQAGSPAIDTGMDTSGPTYGSVVDDIEGTLRPQDGDGLGAGGTGDGSDYDIGAYEYSQVQVTTVRIDQIWTGDGTGTWNVVFNPGDTITVNEAITIQGDPNEVYKLLARYFFIDSTGTATMLGINLYQNSSPGTYYVSLTATVPAGAAPGRGVVRSIAVLAQGATVLDRDYIRGFVNIE